MEQLSRTQNSIQFVGLIYAGLIAISNLRGYFHLFELPWYATQFAYGAIILLGIVWIFITGKTDRLNTSVNVMLFQMIPQIIMMVWSVAIWVWNRETLASILRGSSQLLYQLLLLTMLISAGVMFGRKAIEYTALGFIMANSLVLLDVIRRFGVASTVSGFTQFLLSAGSHDNVISQNLEVQDLTFGFGILLLYYIFEGKDEHWRRFYIIAFTFFIITGFKRILFLAFAVGFVYLFLVRKMTKKLQTKLSIAIGLSLIILSIVYVVLIKTDLLFKVMDYLGIDLMGRRRLYNHVKQYYEISPAYMGVGFGRLSKILEAVEVTENRRLHSDILRLYIELGMPVFLLWSAVTYIFTYNYFRRLYSLASAKIYFAVTILMFVTFLTDNTIEKFCPMIAWHILPLALVLKDKEAFAESLLTRRKNVPEQERRIQWVK